MLGNIQHTDTRGNVLAQPIPLGGQEIVVVNLEYRFPLFGWQSVWGEVFVDAGQIYRSPAPLDYELDASTVPPTPRPVSFQAAPYPPLRITPGIGLILKLGFPLKIEYAADWKRITGRPRTQDERDTQLKSLLISAGFQF